MITTFQSDSQKELFDATTQELESIGYSGDLLEIDYRFPDYFRAGVPERTAAAAAFGQTPPSYRTACFGVLVAGQNSHEGKNLVESCRALGAPLHFEVRLDRVALWIVGKDGQTTRVRAEYTKSELHQAFKQHIDQWSPSSILRAKNIGFAPTPQQLDFFDLGLIPALEAQIEEKLDPILRNALAAAQRAYKKTAMAKADGRDLFRLAFRLLAGKIFHDRGVTGFASLTQDDGPDAVLQLVAKHYGETFPKLLNQSAREAAFERIWSGLDFKNLSIDILTAIWSKTLVTKEVRTGLGIHTTPRAVASYVVNRLPRESFIDLKQTAGLVVEPCCGSATFLVEAMQRIRDELPRSMSPQQRHAYFQNVLVGVETETFGVEVARLCLTLADFPNPNGWRIYEENVFTSPHLPESLSNARVVLCNPPFQTMETDDPLRDHVESFHKPAEILRRVLHNLHPQGVLGFVLPRTFIDGAWYRQTRAELVRRFAELELVSLPDIAFRGSESQHETVLLLATGPRQNGQSCSVRHRRVDKGNWDEFRQFGKPTSDDESIKTVGEAEQSLAVPQLGEVWSRLAGLSKLGEIAKISKGIEWNL